MFGCKLEEGEKKRKENEENFSLVFEKQNNSKKLHLCGLMEITQLTLSVARAALQNSRTFSPMLQSRHQTWGVGEKKESVWQKLGLKKNSKKIQKEIKV